MAVAVVGAGHMGSGLGWALREGGAEVVTTVRGRSARTARLAQAAGLAVLPDLDAVVAQAATVLVVTPPGAARAAAREVADAARRTGARPLVADLNAIAPATSAEVDAIVAAAGLTYVDGSISGPPPTVRPGARIYLAGDRAAEVAGLPWRHVRTVVLPGPAGSASALKMSTASVYKGLNALLAQALRAADGYGVLDEVLADLSAGMGWQDPGSLAVVAAKAERFVAEMREIAAAQAGAGLTPALFDAFADVYADIAGTALAAGDPESADRDRPAAEIARLLRTPIRD